MGPPLEREKINVMGFEPTIDWNRWGSWENKFALVSGGSDSLAMLALVRDHYDDMKALHVDTTAGPSEFIIEILQENCNKLDVPLIIVRPKVDFFTLAKTWGIPRHKARWCCTRLKIEPLKEYLRKISGSRVLFDGMRKEESLARKSLYATRWHKIFKCFCVSPILEWTERQVREFLRERELTPSPIPECYCGAFTTLSDMRMLRRYAPSFLEKLDELEKAMRKGATISRAKIPARKFLDQKLMTDFL